MKDNNRRDFLKRGAMLGATLASASLLPLSADAEPATATAHKSPGSKIRTLGSGKNSIDFAG